MKPIAALLTATLFLSACGVDGPPTPPPPRETTPAAEPEPAIGISVSGTAEMGVIGGG